MPEADDVGGRRGVAGGKRARQLLLQLALGQRQLVLQSHHLPRWLLAHTGLNTAR
jgi:hypothetical protein